jgi:hypothetical protein
MSIGEVKKSSVFVNQYWSKALFHFIFPLTNHYSKNQKFNMQITCMEKMALLFAVLVNKLNDTHISYSNKLARCTDYIKTCHTADQNWSIMYFEK